MERFFINPQLNEMIKETSVWFGNYEEGKMDLKETDYSTLLHDARNVIFVEGKGSGKQRIKEALESAVHDASSVADNVNFMGGKKYLILITTDEDDPIRIEEMDVVQDFMSQVKHDVEYKVAVNQQNTNGKIIVKIAATDLPEIQ